MIYKSQKIISKEMADDMLFSSMDHDSMIKSELVHAVIHKVIDENENVVKKSTDIYHLGGGAEVYELRLFIETEEQKKQKFKDLEYLLNTEVISNTLKQSIFRVFEMNVNEERMKKKYI